VEVKLTAREQSSVFSEWEPSVTILPQKRGVEAEISEKEVTARLSDFGSFTFSFNKKGDEALTLYLAEYEEFSVPEGWEIQRLEAKKHTMAETTFEAENTVYYFEKGRHFIDSVSIPSNAEVYLEAGAYLEVYPDGDGEYSPVFRTSAGTENVKLCGRGVVDFSACMGGDAKKKGAFDFQGTKNIKVDGVISINSNTWTLCFTDCENVAYLDICYSGIGHIQTELCFRIVEIPRSPHVLYARATTRWRRNRLRRRDIRITLLSAITIAGRIKAWGMVSSGRRITM